MQSKQVVNQTSFYLNTIEFSRLGFIKLFLEIIYLFIDYLSHLSKTLKHLFINIFITE